MTDEEEHQKWFDDQKEKYPNFDKIVRKIDEIHTKLRELQDKRKNYMATLEGIIRGWPDRDQHRIRLAQWYIDELQYSEDYRLYIQKQREGR
jgi:hypothetical protein